MHYVVERYEQTPKQEPRVVEQKVFATFEEAEEFYKAHKRPQGWPWTFWAYPRMVRDEVMM